MASVNQTRPHCVNQMGKTHSKHLAARHGRGTAWARHFMCESALTGPNAQYKPSQNFTTAMLKFLEHFVYERGEVSVDGVASEDTHTNTAECSTKVTSVYDGSTGR